MFDVQLDQFKVFPTAMWDKEEGWSTIEQPEGCEHLGVLDGGEVKIVCEFLYVFKILFFKVALITFSFLTGKQMDDGQYYFVPEKIDDEWQFLTIQFHCI